MSNSVNDNDNLRKNQFNNWLQTETAKLQNNLFNEIPLIDKTEEKKTRLLQRHNFNLNNNNSIDRPETPNNDRIKTKNEMSVESASISMCSSSEATETTKFQKFTPRSSRVKVHNKVIPNLDFVDRSIQTSFLHNLHKKDVQIIEPSFLNKLKADSKQKPVYVLYPDYSLPSLDFLNNREQDFSKVLLYPQKFVPFENKHKSRPFSCNDIEMLKKRGFSHIKDWPSLTFLLPEEYRQILASEVPEVVDKIKVPVTRPQFGKPMKARPQSCDLTGYDRTNVSSSSSTGTQPSSGYRGSSTMLLTDSQNQTPDKQSFNPLFIYR